MDILHLLWTAAIFLLGIAWQVVWFLVRDLVSAALWLLIAAWLVLSVRHRSFLAGARTLFRFGGYGLRHLWAWLRRRPAAAAAARSAPPAKKAAVRYRRPFGSVSISEELNMLLVGAILLLFLA